MEDENSIRASDGGAAVGAYLRYLREVQGLGTTEVAEKIGTGQSQIWRIDNWKSDVRGTLLFRYIEIVGGDANDVLMLINNPNATVSDGETLARLRYAFKRK